MGDRYNIHRDEDEARHYRETVPLRWRVLRRIAAVAAVAAAIALFFTLSWQWNHP